MNRNDIAFARFHPTVLFFYFFCLILFTVFTQNPVLLLSALCGGILFCAVTNTAKKNLAAAKLYVPMFLLVSMTNPIFSHSGATPLFFMNDNPVTLEALLCGVDLAVQVCAVMLICGAFSRVMESDKLLALFGKLSPRLATVLSMALRFIPLLKRKWGEICEAQRALGYFREESFFDRIASYARVFSALVTWALESSVDTAASMSARGYELAGKKHFSLFRFTRGDGIMLALTTALSAVTLFGILLGKADFDFYPRISEINTDIFAIITYAAFGTLALLPFIFEVKEALKWKYLRSKI
ncbi:MAG: energy-coupling factor transporter transmembrane protein EcfT [Clostridia bacterium]|nr:energy-coupling factor transporter transmembrane protein EcfT [Clostridia bacterium]